MKKYILIALVFTIVGVSTTYAYTKLNMVWEFSKYSMDIDSISTYFQGTEQVKVYKFTDDKVNCYVSIAPSWVAPKEGAVNKTYNTAISCVK